MASMPGTSASRATEFSAKRGVSPRSKPECGITTTRSAPFGPHLRHQAARGLHDVAHEHAALPGAAVPQHDLRRHEADHADLQRVRRAGLVGEAALQDHVGREGVRPLAGRAVAVVDVHVGADVGEVRARDGLAQEGQAVVELVVADVGGVHAQRLSTL
jgi:hypothetical protein